MFRYPQIEENEKEIYFQQDGAPPHFSMDVRDSVSYKFGNKWIGREGPIECAQNSSNLTVPTRF